MCCPACFFWYLCYDICSRCFKCAWNYEYECVSSNSLHQWCDGYWNFDSHIMKAETSGYLRRILFTGPSGRAIVVAWRQLLLTCVDWVGRRYTKELELDGTVKESWLIGAFFRRIFPTASPWGVKDFTSTRCPSMNRKRIICGCLQL